ncbi:hypothetical protein BH23VER1_BH23VER1_34680 [soil metagenome]
MAETSSTTASVLPPDAPEALLVGEKVVARRELATLLSRHGFRILTCPTLEAGLASFHLQPLVFADIPPGSNGEVSRFVSYVRARANGHRQPLILGIGNEPPGGGLEASGLNDLLSDPIDLDYLNRRLAQAFAAAGEEVAPPPSQPRPAGSLLERIFAGRDAGEPKAIQRTTFTPLQDGSSAEMAPPRFQPLADSMHTIEAEAPRHAPTTSAPAPAPAPIPAPRPAGPPAGPSPNHLRILLENAPLAMAMFDRDMRYLFANDLWLREFHLQDVDVVGRIQYDVFPDLHQSWRQIYERCLTGHIERCEEDIFARADGSQDWVRWEVRPWDSGGTIGGLIISCEIITQLKNAERQFRFERELAGSLLSTDAAAVMVVDLAGRVVRANPRARELGPCGQLAENAAPFWSQLLNGHERDAAREQFASAARNQTSGGRFTLPPTSHESIDRPDGTTHVAWTNIPQTNDDGRVEAVLRIASPSSPRQPSPAELTEPTETTETTARTQEPEAPEAPAGPAADHLPDPVWRCDPHGHLDYVNDAWLALRGTGDREAELGKKWLRTIHKDDRAPFAQSIADAINSQGSFSVECRLESAEDTFVPVRLSARPLVENSELSGLLGSAVEIRSQVAAEDTLQSLRRELSELRASLLRERRSAALAEQRQPSPAQLPQLARLARPATSEAETVTAHVPFGLLLLGTDGQLLFHNAQHADLLGASAADFDSIEDWLADRCPDPALADEIRSEWRDKVWRKQVTRVFPLANHDDLIKEIQFRPTLLKDGRLLVVIADVTEPHRSEEALRSSEARLRALVRDCGLPLATVDRTGDIASASSAFEDLLGYTPLQTRRLRIDDCLHPDDLEDKNLLLAELGATAHETGTTLVRALAHDGTPIPAELRASLGRDEDGAHSLTAFVLTPTGPAAPPTGQDAPEAAAAPAPPDDRLREIHHRARNNLQIISSLLSLQRGAVEDASARSALTDSQNRVRALAFIHQQLTGSSSTDTVDFAAYAQELASHLLFAHEEEGNDLSNRVRADIAFQDLHISFSTATCLALILNELFTNALDHAFPGDQTGRVLVELSLDECLTSGTLGVRDNGAVLPPDFDRESSRGLGLQIFFTLAEQIDGTVEILDDDETEFRVHFQLGH